MFIDTPHNTLKIASLEDGITDDGRHYLLRMRQDDSTFFLQNRNVMPSLQNYTDAASFLSEITGLKFDADSASAILSLYPQVRIKLAKHNGIGNTDVRHELSFAASHFFLGCTWPTYGDKVNIDAFVALLQAQGAKMGFQRLVVTA